MLIKNLLLESTIEQVTIKAHYQWKGGEGVLWYQFPAQYASFLTAKLDGFLVALLPLAMQGGEDIHLEGVISQKLYYNLTNYYISILAQTTPGLSHIKIFPAGLDDGSTYKAAGGVATGFSAGIDSFCCVADHLYSENIPDAYKITHFLFNHVGAHGSGDTEKSRKLFKDRYNFLKNFPDEIRIPYIPVNSNLSELISDSFPKTHTPRNISVALQMQKLFSKYYYASGIAYPHIFIGRTNDTAYSDPITLPLLSTETLECVASGSQYPRTEKTRIVAALEPARRFLNVCVQESQNCSRCWKCLRTLLTLEILKELYNFEQVFNLEIYRRYRDQYIIKVLADTSNALNQEIITLAKQENFHFPAHLIALSCGIKILPRKVLTLPGKIKRRLSGSTLTPTNR